MEVYHAKYLSEKATLMMLLIEMIDRHAATKYDLVQYLDQNSGQ